MEVMLRVRVPDRLGALAQLTAAISAAGGDIQAVEVIESAADGALDDLIVVVEGPQQLERLCEQLRALAGFDLIHAGLSRGAPGDAVTRLAVGMEALLNGAMTLDHGIQTLLGGLLRASRTDLVDPQDAAPASSTRMVLAIDHRVLVLERDYRFTDTEQRRAEAVLRAVLEAASVSAR